MKTRNLNLAALFLCLLLPCSLLAQIYQCGTSFYDSTTLNREGCEQLKASSVCGSDGNRYISPSKDALPVMNQRCSTNDTRGPSRSPFIQVEKDKITGVFGAVIDRKNTQSKNGTKDNGSSKDFKSSLDKLFKVFGCAGQGFGGEVNQEECKNLVTPGLNKPPS